ncbi:hypothetical protein [Catenulispora rubra]|uniref:hypothetical protein n=1 Tax=Catenulispora rubra TaxID=280293 RepID=UPI0018921917|nr:hypothetical protein [Catenulispora rubra]
MTTATVRHRLALVAVLTAVPLTMMGCSSSTTGALGATGKTSTSTAVGTPTSGSAGGGATTSAAAGDGSSSSAAAGDDTSSSASTGDDSSTSAPAGDGATTSAPAGDTGNGKFPNACSLITQDQATAALGEPVKPGGLVPLQGGGGTCSYGATDNSPHDVVVQIAGSDVMKQVLDGQKTQPVSGLGDEAYVYGIGSDIFNIYVRKGTTTIDINIAIKDGHFGAEPAMPSQPVVDALTTLAKTALGKI